MNSIILKYSHSLFKRAGKNDFQSYFLQVIIGTVFARLNFDLKVRSVIIGFFVSRTAKRFLLFLFIFSLQLSPPSGYELSSLAPSAGNPISILPQKSFGIPFFSPSVILLSILTFLLIWQWKRARSRLKFYGFEITFVCFLIFVLISTIFAYDTNASLVWFLKLIFGLSVYFVFSRLNLDFADLKVILYSFLATVVLNVGLAGLQFVHGGLVGAPFEGFRPILPIQTLYAEQGQYFRAVGFLSQPNRLSAYLAILLPAVLVFGFLRNFWQSLICYVAVGGAIFVSFLALSRWGVVTNLFALFMALILVGYLIKPYRRVIFSRVKIYALATLICLAGLFVNQTISARFLQFSSQDRSLAARFGLVDQALFVISNYPILGIGGGNFPLFFINYDATESSQSQRFPAPVHNFYLLLTSEIGFLGLFSFSAAMVAFVHFFFVKFKKIDRTRKLLALGFFGGVLTFLFGGMWTLNYFDNRHGLLFWLLLGLLVNNFHDRRLTLMKDSYL